MHNSAPSILERILADMRIEVERRCAAIPLGEMIQMAEDTPEPRDFREALEAPGVSLIAEFKRASPSKGNIYPGADPANVVRAYAEGGASALSVLTNEKYFRGSDDDLRRVRGATDLPILRKDFVVSEYQLYEARSLQADAVLLIVATLSDSELNDLLGLSSALGLTALVETHTVEEIDRAVAADSTVIGVNNRDLHTFETALSTTEILRQSVPPGITIVSESGIHSHEDVDRLRRSNIDAILVGESLMRSAAKSGESLSTALAAQIHRLMSKHGTEATDSDSVTSGSPSDGLSH